MELVYTLSYAQISFIIYLLKWQDDLKFSQPEQRPRHLICKFLFSKNKRLALAIYFLCIINRNATQNVLSNEQE